MPECDVWRVGCRSPLLASLTDAARYCQMPWSRSDTLNLLLHDLLMLELYNVDSVILVFTFRSSHLPTYKIKFTKILVSILHVKYLLLFYDIFS